MEAKLVVGKAQELDRNLENSPKLTKTFGNKPTYKGLKLTRLAASYRAASR